MRATLLSTDVCILGAGFGGSLLALILRKLGRDVVLVDKGKHPRFAIGESSTPIGNRVLFDLCRRYGLAEIEPLCKWGTWQRSLPQLRGGLKRGFTYFFHEYDQPFEVFPDHRTELLVVASANNEHSDTHWLRADVDQYFCQCAERAGALYLDETHAMVQRESGQWKLTLSNDGRESQLSARFLIHAAGPSGELARALDLGDETSRLRTSSRGLFAHFSNMTPWTEFMSAHGMSQVDHPYSCDDAAIHQVFPGGWMWQLRFAHQVVSAGFSLKELNFDASVTPEGEFSRWLARLPSLDEQMRERVCDLEGPVLTRTGRMQRLVARAAGEGFWLLPFSAGFISPLQSTGIAHTFTAIERIARYFADFPKIESRHFAHHDAATRNELLFIDTLISLCYDTTHRPELFHLAIMTYFAAVTSYEKQRAEQGDQLRARFIGASDSRLRDKVRSVSVNLRAAAGGPFWNGRMPIYPGDLKSLTALIQNVLNDYDHIGLFNPKTPRMYEYTAAPEF